MKKPIEWLDAHLIDDWKKGFTKLSVIWNTLCAAAAPIWVSLSDDQKSSILAVFGVHPALYVSVAFLIGVVLRLARQGKREDGQ
jgi:hypothetical protein